MRSSDVLPAPLGPMITQRSSSSTDQVTGPTSIVAIATQRDLGEVDQQVGVDCLASGFGHSTIVPYRDAATSCRVAR